MLKNTGLENLEIKLQNAKIENVEKFEKIEISYNKNYKKFVDWFFKTDLLWVKKTISGLFQLEAFNRVEKIWWEKNLEIFWKEILEKALEKWLQILPIKENKIEILKNKILKLDNYKDNFWEIFREKTEFSKDKNYPIIESLFERKILDKSEMLIIFTNYEQTKDIRLSFNWIKKNKVEIIKNYFYKLNFSNKEEKITNFKNENSEEIKKLEEKYPANIVNWVVKFVGRNFFKMKPYKKNIESKKLRLKRTFKIALLKLLRIKYSWFNIEELIKKINSMQDFESMFKLIMKLIDIIPENNELLEKFSLKEEVDEIEEIIWEAESNKEKILSWEEATVKICKIINSWDKKIDKKVLDKILDENTDIIWEEMVFRDSNLEEENRNLTINKSPIIPFYKEDEQQSTKWLWKSDDDDDDDENLEEIYKQLKIEFNLLEEKKRQLFAFWDFDELDNINEEILNIMIKIEKVEKIMV